MVTSSLLGGLLMPGAVSVIGDILGARWASPASDVPTWLPSHGKLAFVNLIAGLHSYQRGRAGVYRMMPFHPSYSRVDFSPAPNYLNALRPIEAL